MQLMVCRKQPGYCLGEEQRELLNTGWYSTWVEFYKIGRGETSMEQVFRPARILKEQIDSRANGSISSFLKAE